ncbi:MAG: hypothetical protein SGPRY_009838 [Prymnesium sp.]
MWPNVNLNSCAYKYMCTQLEIVNEVKRANLKAGFGRVQDLYQTLKRNREFYSYNFPDSAKLPSGLTMCPFNARNDPESQTIYVDHPLVRPRASPRSASQPKC